MFHPRMPRGSRAAILMMTALAAWLAAPVARAVPSFARQTGMACEACHTVFPELTHFGRMFKANGYNIDNLKPVRGITATKEEMLALSGLPPISLMVQVSQTNLSKNLPEGTDLGTSQSGTVAFPQQISLFYAGKIAPGVGSFIQLTYGNDSGSVGIDNVDLRWADNRLLADDRSLVYGIDANNNPTVQDLWNSTPAFGYPYASSNAAVPAIAGTQIDGTLGQDVASCHGANGAGTDQFPRLAGQHAQYLLKQLRSFQSNLRDMAVMHGVAQGMALGEMEAVAAYLESLSGA
jgi:cytochrome c553